MVVGDFNGDHKPDLATANAFDGTVSLLIGNGDGTFRTHVDYAAGAGSGRGLSVSRLYDLFLQATGTAPARYIRTRRFGKARDLLPTTHLTVKGIAESVGIPTATLQGSRRQNQQHCRLRKSISALPLLPVRSAPTAVGPSVQPLDI